MASICFGVMVGISFIGLYFYWFREQAASSVVEPPSEAAWDEDKSGQKSLSSYGSPAKKRSSRKKRKNRRRESAGNDGNEERKSRKSRGRRKSSRRRGSSQNQPLLGETEKSEQVDDTKAIKSNTDVISKVTSKEAVSISKEDNKINIITINNECKPQKQRPGFFTNSLYKLQLVLKMIENSK
ncbi:hypothetical protein HELRODRAFT_172610 [Helobdella robusta]|uniref:Uncharacterized protein n=1 Tax=Helobdella robusta TaxID=6412 RepID=T1F5M3_HELRO|nr:hypothetical protein HELRODRAFT_172610 [Helobdella robusta]ESO04254.1 hypothetical protein HELRODRAFT_172610 [Helobdella robusta]